MVRGIRIFCRVRRVCRACRVVPSCAAATLEHAPPCLLRAHNRMQVTEDDDPESRGRLAPHELPHVMACVLAAQRRVQRCVAALAATRAAGDDDAVERRLIQKTARARRQKRCLCMALACHFMSYDSVQMAPLQHAAAEMTEPWNELPKPSSSA